MKVHCIRISNFTSVVVCGSVLQCVAMCYSVSQCIGMQCVAESVAQCAAVCCSVLQTLLQGNAFKRRPRASGFHSSYINSQKSACY